MLQKLKRIFGKRILRPIIADVILYSLVYRNYRQRTKGQTEDEWYWTDKMLTRWGYVKRKNVQ